MGERNRSGQDGLAYMGVRAQTPPNVVQAQRAPGDNDTKHDIGTLWINKASDDLFCLTNISSGSPVWAFVSAGAVGNDGDLLVGDPGGVTSSWQSKGVYENSVSDVVCEASPLLQSSASTGAAPAGTTGAVNLMMMPGGDVMEQFILGAGQTIIAPRMEASDGLLVSLDLTDNEGAEYNWGMLAGQKNQFVVGTDAPYVEWKFKAADVSGCDPVLMGFRKVEANDADYTNYTDYGLIGLNSTVNAGTVIVEQRINSGAADQDDTTDAWADTEAHTLRVSVSIDGVLSYQIDGAAPTVAPTEFTLDSGDSIAPCFHMLHGTTSPGKIHWQNFHVGLQ